MAEYKIIKCHYCGSLVTANSKWKKRTCPHCGAKLNVRSSKSYGVQNQTPERLRRRHLISRNNGSPLIRLMKKVKV